MSKKNELFTVEYDETQKPSERVESLMRKLVSIPKEQAEKIVANERKIRKNKRKSTQ
jgi:hypothetical protein